MAFTYCTLCHCHVEMTNSIIFTESLQPLFSCTACYVQTLCGLWVDAKIWRSHLEGMPQSRELMYLGVSIHPSSHSCFGHFDLDFAAISLVSNKSDHYQSQVCVYVCNLVGVSTGCAHTIILMRLQLAF